MKHRRVAVTGIGAVTPLGNTIDSTWKGILEGRSGIAPIKGFDPQGYSSRVAGEVKNFEAADWLPRREISLSDPFLHFALAASSMALEDSRILEDPAVGERTGTCIGTGVGGLRVTETNIQNLLNKGPRAVSPFAVPFTICDVASGYVSIKHKLRGPNHCIVSACASSAAAIGEGFWMIQRGAVDAMLVGGAESFTPLMLAGFASARALTTSNEEPQKASKPFDLNRDGFVLSEGGACLVLEDLDRARSRGARIYGEVVGYGSTADAFHLTSPDPSGEGASKAIREALAMAEIGPEQIDYINAHATSTTVGDKIEAATIIQVFGSRVDQLPVSSTKSMTGHMIGASGAIEAIFCLLAMVDSVCPPTINQTTPDPDCPLDTVPNAARKKELAYTLSNSFGFGGHNVSLVFRNGLDG